jgi:hypothetical protein
MSFALLFEDLCNCLHTNPYKTLKRGSQRAQIRITKIPKKSHASINVKEAEDSSVQTSEETGAEPPQLDIPGNWKCFNFNFLKCFLNQF